jgi:hypothetical protein
MDEATSDADLHKITTNQTVLTVNAESFKIAGSSTYGSNLGIKLELLTPSGTVVAASSAAGQSSGTLTSNISPGTFYIRVSGGGNGSPLTYVPSGFTSYGSMGAYKLWGTAGSSNNSFAPVLGNGSSSSTTTNSTRLSATANPNGLATNFYFQYGNSPSLGLDLQGGASVTLVPAGDYEPEAINVAVEIIRSRVDSIGVAEPEIIRQGDTVVVMLVVDHLQHPVVVQPCPELLLQQVLCLLHAAVRLDPHLGDGGLQGLTVEPQLHRQVAEVVAIGDWFGFLLIGLLPRHRRLHRGLRRTRARASR